jgi:fucose 4-O-acetylase-like acetyltransferase
MGVVLMLMSFAYLWTTFAVRGWSWVRQLGTTSLLIYWVHTELVYGRFSDALKERLSVGQTALAASVVIALMVGLSLAQTNWARVREYLPVPRTRRPVAETE